MDGRRFDSGFTVVREWVRFLHLFGDHGANRVAPATGVRIPSTPSSLVWCKIKRVATLKMNVALVVDPCMSEILCRTAKY